METDPCRPCFVYLVQAGSAIKIGIALNVGARVLALQSGNPFPMEVIGRRRFPSSSHALEAERALHSRFADQRAQGEWFWISAKQALAALEHFDPMPRSEQGPAMPPPAFVAFDYVDQLRLMARAEFYTEA